MASASHDFTRDDVDYDSTNEEDEDTRSAKRARRDLADKPRTDRREKAKAGRSVFSEEAASDEGRRQRFQLSKLNAYDRHKQLINTYQLYYPGATGQIKRDTTADRRDIDVIREHHRFIWSDQDDDSSWEVQLARRYYDKLFKEYCIIDLSRYKENKFGMRWRTEKEVVVGKGQFACANKRCEERRKLRTWEVNFSYVEDNEKKNALVKCRLCFECSYKLNYHHKKKEVTRRKKKAKKRKKKKSKSSSRDDTSSSSDSDDKEQESLSAKKKVEEKRKAEEEKLEKDASKLWSGPVEREEEKSRTEVFDEFLEELFL